MRSVRNVFLVGVLGGVLCLASAGWAANSVTVESKSVYAGQTGVTVGLYFQNTASISAVVLPLEIRTLTGGAYMADSTLLFGMAGRVAASGLLDFPTLTYHNTPAAQFCSGPVSSSWGGDGDVGPMANDGSPDAVFWVGVTVTEPDGCLPPGVDPPGSPSIVLTFEVNNNPGTFVIDTACKGPAGHLESVDCASQPLLTEFTQGVITVVECGCDCLGDPQCDGLTDVLDVVQTVNVAFRSQPDIVDPNTNCPSVTTDVTCDDVTNVLDVVRFVNVAFRGGIPSVEFCDPCAP